MSAVTSQPRPFAGLQREKHIQVIFRAFQRSRGPRQTSSPASRQHPPACGLTEVKLQRHCEPAEMLEDGAAFLSALETVSQFHIQARPNLQGPQSISRRTFSITTGSRSPMFVAVEESSCLCLQCCGPARESSLLGFDSQGQEIFYFERPIRVDACCFACCLMEMRAYSPQKQLIGTVRQRWSVFTPLLEVLDSEGASAVTIQGSCCPCRCSSNQKFQIVSSMGEEIGAIWKKWPGFSEERNMDHEYFGLEVTLSMKSHIKLLLLAATFLLNHMFFEMS